MIYTSNIKRTNLDRWPILYRSAQVCPKKFATIILSQIQCFHCLLPFGIMTSLTISFEQVIFINSSKSFLDAILFF